MIPKSQRWQTTALAAATAALLGLTSSNVMALSLGRVTVQSALGEPLRAEIEIPDISAEELGSLKAAVAHPDAFRVAGLEYNPAMANVQITLQRRQDGRAFLRLSTARPVNDPFVDMILEASWSSGRIVRDYTMLFDPPSLRQPQAVVTVPQVSTNSGASSEVRNEAASPSRQGVGARAIGKNSIPEKKLPINDAAGRQVIVKPGDTASKIASSNKTSSVSLDQMLVAMLRGSPEAFVSGNINRIKAGAVINMPGSSDAASTPASEATQIVATQSKDFNDFRRKLAANTPLTQIAAADRKASGSVQTKLDDKAKKIATPDKLSLSKGAIQSKAAEDKIARERAEQEAQKRAAELTKNLSDLSKVAAASGAAAAAKAPADSKAPVGSGIAALVASSVAPTAASTAQPALVAVSAPIAVASAPVTPMTVAAVSAAASVPAPAVSQVVAGNVSTADSLLDNPLLPVGAAALVALVAGFGVYRMRQRKKDAVIDSSYLESRLQPDSFFGASGGQQVDTNDGSATGSSMVYSPSQLDAADDVDPVAEADVYLAYGRDLQAEEILKEALRTNTQRVAIHQKLLEIYAKRKDAKAFESIANQAYKLTNGEGPDWTRICDLGLSFDPTNALYEPGGAPFGGSVSRLAALEVGVLPEQALAVAAPDSASPSDLDLDLDFSLDHPSPAAVRAPSSGEAETTVRMNAMSAAPATSLDFDLGLEAPVTTRSGAISSFARTDSVEFELPELPKLDVGAQEPTLGTEDFEKQAAVSFGATAPAPLSSRPVKAEVKSEPDTGMLEFDLGSLSLDLGDSTEGSSMTHMAPHAATHTAHDDPLATKLALAEEFNAIGDADGARALIEEVVAEATGDMKAKAQRALSNL